MNKKDRFNIDIPETLDIEIDKGINKGYKEIQSKKASKRKLITGIAAVGIVIFIIFGVVNPTFAAKLPIVGNIFKAIEKTLIYPSEYSKYATSINETVTDNGVSITLSEILCDGEGLYVTYIVESEKPFKHTSWGDAPLTRTQMLTRGSLANVSFSDEELDDSGIAGLQGKFIDERTFIGMQRYRLKSLNKEIPDSFNFKVKLTSVGTKDLTPNEDDDYRKGEWAFNVPVKVDTSLSKTFDIKYKGENGYSIDSILITPFTIIVNSSNPNENSKSNIKAFDEANNEIPIESGRYLKDSNGNFDNNKVSTSFHYDTSNLKNIRIVLYKSDSDDVGKIVTENTTEILLEKIISLE